MEKISQLMDGELGGRESRSQIRRLESDPGLCDSWETYHLIRDALRREAQLRPDFTRRVHALLESEPTIVAPHTQLAARAVRYTLPMAAGLAGIAVVGWLAMSGPGQPPATAPGTSFVAERPPAPEQPVDGAMRDYMLAHQEFSPSTAMQGVASYVRTVSTSETPGAE